MLFSFVAEFNRILQAIYFPLFSVSIRLIRILFGSLSCDFFVVHENFFNESSHLRKIKEINKKIKHIHQGEIIVYTDNKKIVKGVNNDI